jgi:N-acylneuraminate cytidylyltransferase/CMP-N,N'-diacetyllegionaminic acid synthase
VVVDLDATSPLRTADDVRGAVALLESSGADNVITGAPAHRSPYFNMVEVAADGSVALAKAPGAAIARRQDAPPCYDMNASIYVWRRAALDAGDTVPPHSPVRDAPGALARRRLAAGPRDG